eukprot:gene10860-12650_t
MAMNLSEDVLKGLEALSEEKSINNDAFQAIISTSFGVILKTDTEDTLFAIRKTLSITNFHFPHVIDVNWRLDYFMKSNSMEKINTPVYLVNLTTEKEEGEKGHIEFACTLDQLQDLVFKLRDAQKQIERSSLKA